MTADNPMLNFMVRLRRIDNAHLVCRDVLIMWAVKADPGMMGRELAMKLGYKSRSNVQEHVARLIRLGFIEDRRVKLDNRTPNDLHITPAGIDFLAETVPT
jgi:DNA-binding MarR family transcriptional regulator